MLDEDGVTGQVAMDDGRITGVEVAADAEQSTGQGLEPLPRQETSEGIRRAKGTCQGFTAAGRYNSMTVTRNKQELSLMNLQNMAEGKRKLSPISSQETQGTRGKDTISSNPVLLSGF